MEDLAGVVTLQSRLLQLACPVRLDPNEFLARVKIYEPRFVFSEWTLIFRDQIESVNEKATQDFLNSPECVVDPNEQRTFWQWLTLFAHVTLPLGRLDVAYDPKPFPLPEIVYNPRDVTISKIAMAWPHLSPHIPRELAHVNNWNPADVDDIKSVFAELFDNELSRVQPHEVRYEQLMERLQCIVTWMMEEEQLWPDYYFCRAQLEKVVQYNETNIDPIVWKRTQNRRKRDNVELILLRIVRVWGRTPQDRLRSLVDTQVSRFDEMLARQVDM